MVTNINVESGMSDHNLVVFDVNLKPTIIKKPPRCVYMFTRGNMSAVRNDLKKYFDNYLSMVAPSKSCDENYQFFKETIPTVINDHIPQKKLSSRWSLPWLNNSIKRMIRKKQRLYNKAKRTGNATDWRNFKIIRKQIKSQLTTAHDEYVADLLSFSKDYSTNKPVPTKRFWSYIKSKKSHDVGIGPLKENGVEITDSIGKANLLSQQFQSVFTREYCEYANCWI